MKTIQITNQLLEGINWRAGSALSFQVDGNVDVWRINISAHINLLEDFKAIMLPDEIARANRYFQLKDKIRYIVSRGGLRHILGRYLNQQPADVRFQIGENKKPYLIQTNNKQIHYNLSHAGDWILLAVAGSEVGVDTEPIDPDFPFEAIMADNFSDEEINFINEASPSERFFLLWTRKEALTKATGKGLDDALKLFPALNGSYTLPQEVAKSANNWLISSFKVAPDYWGTIVNNVSVKKINFCDIDTNILHNNLITD